MRRWRLRYSLRTFLTVVTLFAVVGGLYISRCRQQRLAVALIERLGGTVIYDYQFHWGGSHGDSLLTLFAEPPDHWVTRLLGRDYRHDVVGVRGYQEHYYSDTTGGWASFGPVRKKTEFHKNTDEALRSLRGLRTLEFLDLSKTAVTDAGLAELKSLKRLDRLYLWRTAITDHGLDELSDFRGLSSVTLLDCKVSEEGVRGLQAASPWMEVWHEITTEVRDRERVLLDADKRRYAGRRGVTNNQADAHISWGSLP